VLGEIQQVYCRISIRGDAFFFDAYALRTRWSHVLDPHNAAIEDAHGQRTMNARNFHLRDESRTARFHSQRADKRMAILLTETERSLA
jgi:hypothetical protein